MATQTAAASKYRDIIQKSLKTSSGPPAVYKLNTNIQPIGSVTKVSVGEANFNKVNKTILLVGETGGGKSTLIDALFNFSLGVTFQDNVWFQLVGEERKPQCVSQTSDVIVYEIFDFQDTTLSCSLTIIDTPGYGDTQGIHRDAIVTQRLYDLFLSRDGVHEVNAVGLVMKASTNRLDERQKYIFDSVLSLFDKGLENNIVALITHSNGVEPDNPLNALEEVEVKCAKNANNRPLHFLFDNVQNTSRTEHNETPLKNAWGVSHQGMELFKEFLSDTGPQKLDKAAEVLNSRQRLTACIHNLQTRIVDIELKQNEIQQIQRFLRMHEAEMLSHRNFTIEYDEVYKETVPIDAQMWGLVFYDGATRCKVCQENCHYPGCTMAWTAEHCVVMRKQRCTSCTNKCPTSDHVKDKFIYVSKTRKVRKTDKEMKKRFKEKKAQAESDSSLLVDLETEMTALKEQERQWLQEAYGHVINLNQIALKFDTVSTSVHFDFLIKKMRENGEVEKAKNLERMQQEMHEGTRTALQYVWSQFMGAIRK